MSTWKLKLWRAIRLLLVLAGTIIVVYEATLVVRAYRLELIGSFVSSTNLNIIQASATPLTPFVFYWTFKLRTQWATLSEADIGFLTCFAVIDGATADNELARLGLNILAGLDSRSRKEISKKEQRDLYTIRIIANTIGTDLDRFVNKKISDTEHRAFLAEYYRWGYDARFFGDQLVFAPSIADGRIIAAVNSDIESSLRLVNSGEVNLDRLLIRVESLIKVADQYLSDDIERKQIHDLHSHFIKTVQEYPVNDLDSED